MANINVTPGTGKTVSTDSVGGVEYQYIKIIDGTAGNNTNVAPVSTNGLHVDVKASVLPTGAATAALQTQPGVDIGDVTINNASGGSAVNIQDGGNSITVDYATTGSGTATGALRVELPTNGTGVIATVGAVTAITNALPAGTNAIGKLAANSGVDIGDVDVTTVGTITPGTAATSLGKAEDAAHASGDVGVFSLGVANEAQTSLAADGDYIAQATDTKGNTLNVGNIAHDGVDAGNPLKVGAQARSSEPTAVASADRVNLIADLVGKLIVLPYANPENFVSGAITSAMTGTTSTSLIAAPAAGLRNYITQITVSNAHATVGTDVIIQDGSGGTTLYTIPAAAVYGGATITFPTPLRQPTTATAIYCANVTTGASTKVSASGYKGV